MAIEKRTVYRAEANCPECDEEWEEDHAGDIGWEVGQHERETGHNPNIFNERKIEFTVNTRTGEVINEKEIEE